MPLKIAAFPKCYIDRDRRRPDMSVFDWIDMARSLDADGLEMYDGFFTSLEPAYLDRVGEAIRAAGFAMPMLCCSPDFTNPDADGRKRAVDREAELIGVARRLGGPRTVCRVLSGQRYPEVSRAAGAGMGRRRASTRCSPSRASTTSSWGSRTTTRTASGSIPNSPRRRTCSSSCSRRSRTAITSACSTTLERDRRRRRSDRAAARRGRSRGQHARQRPVSGRGDDARRPAADRRHARLFAQPAARRDRQGTQRLRRHLPHPGRAPLPGWISIEDGMNGMDEMAESLAFLRRMGAKYFPD